MFEYLYRMFFGEDQTTIDRLQARIRILEQEKSQAIMRGDKWKRDFRNLEEHHNVQMNLWVQRFEKLMEDMERS